MTTLIPPLPTSVPTVADLSTARARTANGGILSTTGYGVSGDGGGQGFVYRRGGRSGITIPSGFYSNGAGLDDYFEALEKTYVNIRRFGCVGDGVTDDTAKFTEAAQAADALGVNLYVPPGNYLLASLTGPVGIEIENGLTMYGDGEESIITGPGTESGMELFWVRRANPVSISCDGISFQNWYRVFNFEGLSTPLGTGGGLYTITLTNNFCDNFGVGLLGVNPGAKINATSIQILNNRCTNMCVQNDEIRSMVFDLALIEFQSVTISNNNIDGVGSEDHDCDLRVISVDCTYAPNDSQPGTISNNVVKNVISKHPLGQTAAIIALEGKFVITNNAIDTVVNDDNPSSPEAIYIKSSKSIISTNTIMDCIGTEGVINLKGEYTGSASAEGSIVSNNTITFRSMPLSHTRNSTGVNVAAPHVTVQNNTIEGVNRGVATVFTGTIIQGNTFRYCNVGCVESICDVPDVSLIVKGNTFKAVGNVNNETSSGISITTPDNSSSYDNIEITDNTFENFVEGPYSSAVRIVVGSTTTEIRSLKINRNSCNHVNNFVSLLGTETIRYLEMSLNSIYGVDSAYVNTTQIIRSKKLLNIENGGFWSGNDSPIPYDPTSVSGCEAYWTTRITENVKNNATYTANDMEAIGEIKDISGNDVSLLGTVHPILHSAARSGLPSQAAYMRGLGDGLYTTLPAACGADCTMFLVGMPGYVTHFTVDVDSNTLTHDTLNYFSPANDMPIKFHGKNLPAPLVAGTTYYARDVQNVDLPYTLKVAATIGGAAINLTSAGSGAFNYRGPDTKFNWWYQDPDGATPTSTAADLRRLWSGEDGGAGDGEGLLCGTPTFRVNGVDADFTTTDDVWEATSEQLTVVTAEGLDLSGWSNSANDFRLGSYLKSADAGHIAGYFCACLLFNGPLSETDRDAIEAFLMDEWEIV